MEKPYPAINYSDYLQVKNLISLQKPKSIEYGKPAHDEMLFVIIHQVYELWFKQILWEIDSVLSLFDKTAVEDRDTLKIVSRLNRVIEIQKLLIQQIDVLETMTPMDFLEFRDYLYPASGFQSHQFRLIENKLGLKQRLKFNNEDYKNLLKKEEALRAQQSEDMPSLFSSLENWLERTPFIFSNAFPFWSTYKQAVDKMFTENETAVKNSGMDEDSKKIHLAGIQSTRESFTSIFDESNYTKLQEQGMWRLSFKALQAALFILLYRDEPLLQLPYNLMAALQNIDENFTQWRQRHALMAHRMLGTKMGTGGSAGHKYLEAAANKHKVFTDLFNLSTFIVPKSSLPELPKDIKAKLGFSY